MSEATRTNLQTDPGTIIMENLGYGDFSVIGKVPEWFARLFPDTLVERNELNLGEKLPSLGNFLNAAEGFWLKPEANWLRSEPWDETDSRGNRCQLEAMAVCLRNKKLLLIESLGAAC